MNLKNYGGNIIEEHKLNSDGVREFSRGDYTYFKNTIYNGILVVNDLPSYTIYLLEKEMNTNVFSPLIDGQVLVGDCIQVEAPSDQFELTIQGGSATFLIAGSKSVADVPKGVFLTRRSDIYKVIKPWGHELWLNGQHSLYALKEISIKAGTKTSLQYHKFKKETNLLVKGEALLHFSDRENCTKENYLAADISSVKLVATSSIDVSPPTVHRIEAITDILLYEASTPHLDDVIRLEDDSQRADGRISQEHQ